MSSEDANEVPQDSVADPERSAEPSSLPAAKTQVWSTCICAVAHGAVLLLVLKWFVFVGTVCRQSFEAHDFPLASITERIMQTAGFCCEHLGLLTVLVILFVFVDFCVLQLLGRPSSYRILRELWVALLTFVPLAVIVFGSVSVILTMMQLLDTVARG